MIVRTSAALAVAALISSAGVPDLAFAMTGDPSGSTAVAYRFAYSGELTQGGWLKGTAPTGTQALDLDGRAVPVAPDGAFLIGFDRDAAPAARLTARFADGRSVTETLTIAPRAWQIERINAPLRPPGQGSEEFRRTRAAELARIAAARAKQTGAEGWRQRFILPAAGRISGRFGSQRIYRGEPGSYHSGMDIAGGAGRTFVAPADGMVILAADAPFTLEGRLLMIDHGNGLNSAFLHCAELLVREGESVRQGQPVGLIGATGRATGPHLHWSIKWQDARLDPILFTGRGPG